MKTESSLHVLETLDGYRQHFMDPELWAPHVRQVVRGQLSAAAEDIVPGVAGTYPTFIVNRKWVVKFFGRLFDGWQCWEVERQAAQLLQEHPALPTPRLVAQGEMQLENELRWPFLIFEYIHGEPIGDSMPRFSRKAKLAFASHLGEQVRSLHEIIVPERMYKILPNQRRYYAQAVERCALNHRSWESLPEHLVDQIPRFLEATATVCETTPEHLIHADLTGDHFLGELRDAQWHTHAVIDFGDAMIGQYDYELVAVFLDLFRLDRDMLGAFLAGYGLLERASFPLIAMRATLLHQFDVLSVVPKPILDQKHWKSLEELAFELWRFNP